MHAEATGIALVWRTLEAFVADFYLVSFKFRNLIVCYGRGVNLFVDAIKTCRDREVRARNQPRLASGSQ